MQGLWRGTVPGLLLTVPYTAVQFVALQQCRQLSQRHGLQEHPRWQSAVPFISGAAAGAAATVASYPFDLLRTTMAAQGEPPVYATMTDAGTRRCGACIAHSVWTRNCSFAHHPPSPSSQHHPCMTAPSPPWPHGAARGIVRQRGAAGLYRGLGVTVLEIMPYAALQFGLYDAMNRAYSTARVGGWGMGGDPRRLGLCVCVAVNQHRSSQ